MIDRLFRLKEISSVVQFCRKYRSVAKNGSASVFWPIKIRIGFKKVKFRPSKYDFYWIDGMKYIR